MLNRAVWFVRAISRERGWPWLASRLGARIASSSDVSQLRPVWAPLVRGGGACPLPVDTAFHASCSARRQRLAVGGLDCCCSHAAGGCSKDGKKRSYPARAWPCLGSRYVAVQRSAGVAARRVPHRSSEGKEP